MNEEELYEELEGIRKGAQKNEENLWGKIGDLSCELNNLQQELQRKDNIINELKKWAKAVQLTVLRSDNKPVYERQDVLDKIKELESK